MTKKEYILFTLKSIRAELSDIGIRQVGLFGSYVREEQTEQSDIDILIDFDPDKETFDNFMAVYELLEKLSSWREENRASMPKPNPLYGRDLAAVVLKHGE